MRNQRMELVKITIDGKTVEVEMGATIYDAAKLIGIDIPTLCYMNMGDMNIKHNPGCCRMCVVEVEGRRNLAPSCVTPVTNGMTVNTHNMRVLNARRTVMELMLSDHPFDCLICAKSGNCDLQALAQRLGIIDGDHPTSEKNKHII